MYKLTIVILLLSLSILSSSCKKCMTCSTLCYACERQNTRFDTLCSGGIVITNILLQEVQNMENQGFVCTKLPPKQSYQYCDDNKDMITYLQNSGLDRQ